MYQGMFIEFDYTDSNSELIKKKEGVEGVKETSDSYMYVSQLRQRSHTLSGFFFFLKALSWKE